MKLIWVKLTSFGVCCLLYRCDSVSSLKNVFEMSQIRDVWDLLQYLYVNWNKQKNNKKYFKQYLLVDVCTIKIVPSEREKKARAHKLRVAF